MMHRRCCCIRRPHLSLGRFAAANLRLLRLAMGWGSISKRLSLLSSDRSFGWSVERQEVEAGTKIEIGGLEVREAGMRVLALLAARSCTSSGPSAVAP